MTRVGHQCFTIEILSKDLTTNLSTGFVTHMLKAKGIVGVWPAFHDKGR